MSSLGGLLSLPYTSAYNASKFALEGFTESLRLELLPLGIYVSNLEAAYINSGTIERSIITPSKDHILFSLNRKNMHEKMKMESIKGIPLAEIQKVIQIILQSKQPKFRYKIGKMTKQLTLLSFLLPERIFQKAVLKSFNIPLEMKF